MPRRRDIHRPSTSRNDSQAQLDMELSAGQVTPPELLSPSQTPTWSLSGFRIPSTRRMCYNFIAHDNPTGYVTEKEEVLLQCDQYPRRDYLASVSSINEDSRGGLSVYLKNVLHVEKPTWETLNAYCTRVPKVPIHYRESSHIILMILLCLLIVVALIGLMSQIQIMRRNP